MTDNIPTDLYGISKHLEDALRIFPKNCYPVNIAILASTIASDRVHHIKLKMLVKNQADELMRMKESHRLTIQGLVTNIKALQEHVFDMVEADQDEVKE